MAIDSSAIARGLGIGVITTTGASTSSEGTDISVPPGGGGGGGGPSNQLADDSANLIVDAFGVDVIQG
jgi:hypothetical protein